MILENRKISYSSEVSDKILSFLNTKNTDIVVIEYYNDSHFSIINYNNKHIFLFPILHRQVVGSLTVFKHPHQVPPYPLRALNIPIPNRYLRSQQRIPIFFFIQCYSNHLSCIGIHEDRFIYSSSDAGLHWIRSSCQIPQVTDIKQIALDPTGLAAIGGHFGLLILTNDYGNSWKNISLTSWDPSPPAISSVNIFPTSSNKPIVYIAFEDGLGDTSQVWKSDDHGQHWNLDLLLDFRVVSMLFIHDSLAYFTSKDALWEFRLQREGDGLGHQRADMNSRRASRRAFVASSSSTIPTSIPSSVPSRSSSWPTLRPTHQPTTSIPSISYFPTTSNGTLPQSPPSSNRAPKFSLAFFNSPGNVVLFSILVTIVVLLVFFAVSYYLRAYLQLRRRTKTKSFDLEENNAQTSSSTALSSSALSPQEILDSKKTELRHNYHQQNSAAATSTPTISRIESPWAPSEFTVHLKESDGPFVITPDDIKFFLKTNDHKNQPLKSKPSHLSTHSSIQRDMSLCSNIAQEAIFDSKRGDTKPPFSINTTQGQLQVSPLISQQNRLKVNKLSLHDRASRHDNTGHNTLLVQVVKASDDDSESTEHDEEVQRSRAASPHVKIESVEDLDFGQEDQEKEEEEEVEEERAHINSDAEDIVGLEPVPSIDRLKGESPTREVGQLDEAGSVSDHSFASFYQRGSHSTFATISSFSSEWAKSQPPRSRSSHSSLSDASHSAGSVSSVSTA